MPQVIRLFKCIGRGRDD